MVCTFRGVLGTRLIQCGLHGGLLPYQVASSSIQPFCNNTAGCHSPRRNISTNYYFVVEMHTVRVRSDDARYLLKHSTNSLVYKSSAVAETDDHGHNRRGPKRGRGAVPLSRRAWNLSNTMWPVRRSTSIPSGIFIHPAVWPQ